MTTRTNDCLEVRDLTVSRAEIPLFAAVNFQLNSGQSLQISGGNGAGKTTLLRAICGLCRSHQGQIKWNGRPVQRSEVKSAFYQQLLYLGHLLALKPKLTVEQNLNFYRQLRYPASSSLIDKSMQLLAIDSLFDQPVAKLSAGQKRRVVLCRLISEPASLWLLDEPLVALDKTAQLKLVDLFNQHLSAGGMLIITSHQPIDGLQGLQDLVLS